jgi:hypothetical protein
MGGRISPPAVKAGGAGRRRILDVRFLARRGLDIGHRPFERIDASPSEGSRQVRDQPALRNVSLNADRI